MPAALILQWKSFGFSLTIPKDDLLNSPLIAVSTGVSAMRADHSGGEKPNVRRKYLSPDEARRVIEASARVGRQGERDKLLLAWAGVWLKPGRFTPRRVRRVGVHNSRR